jgi:hypothetical protein
MKTELHDEHKAAETRMSENQYRIAKELRWNVDMLLELRCEAVDLLVNEALMIDRDANNVELEAQLQVLGERLGRALRAVRVSARAMAARDDFPF